MNINATILVQAFNFFVVYWMLRFFLFRPAISIIERDQAEKQSLLSIIDQQKKSLAIQEKEQQRHWYLCQEYFATNQPLQYIFFILPEQHLTQPPIHRVADKELEPIILEICKGLEEKIKHVH